MAVSRISPRLTVDLPVRVWGMNAGGRPFSQNARAQNISSQGALITGVDCELKVGDVIGVQCEETKARCTIMWIMTSGLMAKKQVGLRLPVMRYTATQLHAEFGEDFNLISHERELHHTPLGAAQQFTYCYCRKSASRAF